MTANECARDEAPDADGDADEDADHLADIDDGAGCAEIWEHLSERRDAE